MKPLLTCVAVDDEALALHVMEHYIAKTPALHHLASFLDSMEAVTFIDEQSVDLVFMDMQMPDMSGLDALRHLTTDPLVIIATAHKEFAIPSFAFRTVGYLLKPIAFADFTQAIQKAVGLHVSIGRHTSPTIRIKSGYTEHVVSPSLIAFLKSEANYVKYHFLDRPPLLSLQTMGQALASLPASFIRIHRSYAINVDAMERIGTQHVVVLGEHIPVGQAYRHNLRQYEKAAQ